MSIIQGTSVTGSTGAYQISRSLRFNSADTAYLNRTFSTPTSQNIWSFSAWLKRGKITDQQFIFWAGTNSGNDCALYFSSTDQIGWFTNNGVSVLTTSTAVFRDPSAWYHIVAIANSTTMNVYVNNQQVITNAGMTNNTVNSAISHCIGQDLYTAGNNADFYLTEINFIDGQALTPSSFGETNPTTGVWQPKAYTGTYGTNGFYLNFSDNSGITSTTLGKDYSGNGNNWTPNNFSVTAGAGNDSLVDTPTPYGTDTGAGGEVRGNYCTWNPLDNTYSSNTISNGNLSATTPVGANYGPCKSTFGMSTGKWYWECVDSSGTGASAAQFGIVQTVNVNDYLSSQALSVAYNGSNGGVTKNASAVTTVATFNQGDIVGLAFDADALTLAIYKNNSLLTTVTGITAGTWFAAACDATSIGGGYLLDANFGQRPFAYTAPSGFKALCTQNLPEPTIVDGSQYFDVVTYTGDGATTRSVTGLSFTPDFLWNKTRSNADDHRLVDIVRAGGTDLSSSVLYSNLTNAQDNASGYITQTSSGFDLGVSATPLNMSGRTYVAWNWKANGAGVSNTDGTITSTVSANTDSGFSIVTFNSVASTNSTVGHGLGVAPSMIIVRYRGAISGWFVWHTALAGTQYLQLDTTGATATAATLWNSAIPTSTVFSMGTAWTTSTTSIAYCFAAIQNYSAMGSYLGNGSSDGPFVYTGFRPRYLLVKRTNSTGSWQMKDTARNPSNLADLTLFSNLSNSEYSTFYFYDLLSNGFKVRGTDAELNASGGTYIYAAFAENPFKYSLAR